MLNKNIYNYLIKLGKKIPKYPKKYKINKFLFKDCQTNVWLFFYFKKKKFYLKAFSDSLIINGILFIIIKIYNKKKANKILKIDIQSKLIKKFQLNKLLSINRYIGILNIINKIKKFSITYLSKK
ncbi:MAG: SufE family protein [Candidatus Shikimatogenerans bostrichidophilus]|nr:MAG: SufE family protein [Candidatus Shikimatogenerans bostrichidophilus]